MTIQTFICDEPGSRLDSFLANQCANLSRSRIKRLIVQGNVSVNGRAYNSAYKLKRGSEITIEIPDDVKSHLVAQDIPIDVIFEDEDIMLVNKPHGLPVHPGPGHNDSTLVNGLLGLRPKISSIGGVFRPGLVHRLDMDTSGLMVIAKTDSAHAALTHQFKAKTLNKHYLALVTGILIPQEAIIDAPIGRDPSNRKRMTLISNGKESRTAFSVATYYENKTLTNVTTLTGRTHQIRVHFASIGHPVVADKTYGSPEPNLARQFLHANKLGFQHPRTAKYVEFQAPLPRDLQAYLNFLVSSSQTTKL